jgi:Tol biopolymer transport system component
MSRARITTAIAAALSGAALLASPATAAASSSRIVFSDGPWIERVSPGGGRPAAIARAQRKTAALAATDDGRWIAALSNRGAPGPSPRAVHTDHLRQIYLIGPGGRRHAVLPEAIRTSANPSIAISPDGRLIAFGRDNEIWVVRANGRHMRQVTSGSDGAALDPAFMPDGRTIVFSRYIGLSRAQLYSVGIEGGTARPVPGAGRYALAASVSRSGLIAYLGKGPDTSWQLRTIRLTGGGRRALYRPHGASPAIYTPDFSPDGRRIVLVTGSGAVWDRRRYSLITVSAAGGRARTVLRGVADHHMSPQWTRSR